MKPSSFCTISTYNCSYELIGLLLSLSLYHRNETIYIMCDSKTKNEVDNMTPRPRLNIVFCVELDKYDGLNRMSMVQKGIWSEFQMMKANVIKRALEKSKDTLFLDSDIIIMDIINDVDDTKELGVSPQIISQKYIDETGYYNGGVLWTKNNNVPDDWLEFTKRSRYFDQASIEDLVKKYDYFEFGENYNLQCWRYYLSDENSDKIGSYITSDRSKGLLYKDKPMKFIHTHFLDQRFKDFNQIILKQLFEIKHYKLLLIIYRVINKTWILKIPKQPIQGWGNHKNDSYRELPLLMKVQNKDVELIFSNNTIHCWLEPNILTYDRPTLEWCNNEIVNASLILLGNGDINVEGMQIKKNIKDLNILPWIFWPRKPMLMEKILKKSGILKYNERKIESIFIGNIENNVQDNYRKDKSWGEVLSEYHCTKGQKHKFTHEEYLMKLRESKYGLCLRGYGSKCHREVELMAFGTVPIVTPEVTTTSYMDPLIENVHYIRVLEPEELTEKIKKKSEEEWNIMSNNCYEWYQKNVHSSNCWETMISNILYD
jgi:hypothetical protein